MGGMSDRSSLLPRPDRSLMPQQTLQPPPVPPGLAGMDRPRQPLNVVSGMPHSCTFSIVVSFQLMPSGTVCYW